MYDYSYIRKDICTYLCTCINVYMTMIYIAPVQQSSPRSSMDTPANPAAELEAVGAEVLSWLGISSIIMDILLYLCFFGWSNGNV